MTYDNTPFTVWWERALEVFAALGLREPLFGETHDAYEVGETPETWAQYVRYNDDWQKEVK